MYQDEHWAYKRLLDGYSVARVNWGNGLYIKIVDDKCLRIAPQHLFIPLEQFKYFYCNTNNWIIFQNHSMDISSNRNLKMTAYNREIYTLPDGQTIDPALIAGCTVVYNPLPSVVVMLWKGTIPLLGSFDDPMPIIKKITNDVNTIRMKMYAADLQNLTYGSMAWAMSQLNTGQQIRRSSWGDNTYITYDADNQFAYWVDSLSTLWICKPSDLVATDWETTTTT